MKVSWKPGTMVYPIPAVLVSCGTTDDTRNLITVAWTGTLCTNPPMLYISVRPERYSYDIIKQQREFTVCLTTADMARATDWCGVKSGRDVDKWATTGLTPLPGIEVGCLHIAESPLCIECRVKEVVALGSHDMFVADVVNVIADDRYIDPSSGRFDLAASGLMAYSHGFYYSLGSELGKFGFSVQRTKDGGKRRPKGKGCPRRCEK
ncbi:MAG: flavin reductase family protein [Muribaculaceae bacterium]|nr:flavin reductase family protein [Muribaculaceae bacterium]